MKSRRVLTETEKARAARAKALWMAKKERERITQDDANATLGWSPSSFGQYINARIPMGLEATIKIADFLGVKPSELDPEITPAAETIRRPGSAADIPELFRQLDREDILRIMCKWVKTMPETWRIRLAQACLSGLGDNP